MSRKYRQRGYQDDEPRERKKGKGPGPRREGPRGRGVGKPSVRVFRCGRCGMRQYSPEKIEPTAECSQCGADLHTCTNCRFFDTGAPNECRAGVEVRIAKKSTRNECDLFEAKVIVETESQSARGSDPRSEFDALFDF